MSDISNQASGGLIGVDYGGIRPDDATTPLPTGTRSATAADKSQGIQTPIYVPTKEDIRFLQQMLAGAGFNPGPVDGIWGPRTQAALNEWQRRNGLTVTPTYDGTTKRQLTDALANLGRVAQPAAATPAPTGGGPVAIPGESPTVGGGGYSGMPAFSPAPTGQNFANATDAEIDNHIRQNFGALAWWLHEPELANEVRKAVREGVTDPNQLAGRISNTGWWRNNSASVRSWAEFVHTSGGPGSANVVEAITTRRDEIAFQAKQLGVAMTTQRAWDLAVESLKFNWTQFELKSHVVSDFNWRPSLLIDTVTNRPAYIGPNGEEGYPDNSGNNPNAKSWVMPDGRTAWYIPGAPQARPTALRSGADPGGQAGQNITRLRQIADDYLVPISDGTLAEWAKNMLKGEVDEEMFRKTMVEQAKSLFPGLAQALDRGISVRQYVNPYVELAARELELNPTAIDLKDPKWSKPLFQTTKDGQPSQMSLAEWQTELRRNTQYGWQNTKAARAEASTFALGLLEDFGAIAR